MKYTENLGLKKPEGNDTVNIQDFNDNFDSLDAEVTKIASTTQDGRMTKEDKAKLNGVAAGANKYVHPSTHPASVITEDSSHRFVTDLEKSTWDEKQDPLSGNVTEHYHSSDRAWANITGKPSTYPASSHSHTKSQITDFPSSLPANGGNADTVDGKHAIGTLATTEKSNLVAAINEVFTDVDNGKDTIASAITDMGQGAAGSDSFVTLGNKIKDISSDATAAEGNVLSGKTFYKGSKRTGTMPNRGTVSGSITTQGGQFTIPSGYHSGSGKVTASFANLIASNIREGVNIGGVVGALVEGKRWASGTSIVAGYPYNVIVSGLSFEPSVIIIWCIPSASHYLLTVYIKDQFPTYPSGNNYFYVEFDTKHDDGSGIEYFRKVGLSTPTSNSYVTNGGFSLYTPPNGGFTFNWIAYE